MKCMPHSLLLCYSYLAYPSFAAMFCQLSPSLADNLLTIAFHTLHINRVCRQTEDGTEKRVSTQCVWYVLVPRTSHLFLVALSRSAVIGFAMFFQRFFFELCIRFALYFHYSCYLNWQLRLS